MPTKVPVTPSVAPHHEDLAGLAERVTFHSDESGFCVPRIKARGHRDHVTVVGTLPEVRAGEWLEAQGGWVINKEHGQQFQAEVLRTMPPTTVEGIERYLASGMIKGIGLVLAGRIVKAFKEDTFETIDAEPDHLPAGEGRVARQHGLLLRRGRRPRQGRGHGPPHGLRAHPRQVRLRPRVRSHGVRR